MFSQGTRIHDIISRWLETRGIGYVSVHGGVPAESTQPWRSVSATARTAGALSTGASSAGLNLQHAPTLSNMDLSWNPVILERHSAHFRRVGQPHQVQIGNFVANGIIQRAENHER
ncbi:MAG: hypothetical protein ACYDDA_06070 [Acidiferrobacteraceae bacterium]